MQGPKRLSRGGGRYHDFLLRVLPLDFVVPRLIHMGQPVGINWVVKQLITSGHGAIDEVEGAVWRVERRGKPATVDFLVKFVKPTKQDGIYLPEISGKDAVWNINVADFM